MHGWELLFEILPYVVLGGIVLFAALFLGLWGLIVSAWVTLFGLVTGSLRAYAKAPEVHREAKVAAVDHHHDSHHVAFEFPDGHKEGFTVSPDEFVSLKVGDRGTLTTKMDTYLRFVRTP